MAGRSLVGSRRAAHVARTVVIVTARDDADTLRKTRLAGANGYLSKPFDVDKVPRNAQRACRRSLIGFQWKWECPKACLASPAGFCLSRLRERRVAAGGGGAERVGAWRQARSHRRRWSGEGGSAATGAQPPEAAERRG